MGIPLTGKLLIARWVWAPHSASEGTSTSPRLSCSVLNSLTVISFAAAMCMGSIISGPGTLLKGRTPVCQRRSSYRGPVSQTPKPGASEESERVDVVTGQHALGLLIVFQRHLMGFPAYPGLLVTTKRRMGRIGVIAVHPYPTGLNRPPHPVSPVGIAGPDAGTKTKLGIIGDRQGFLLRPEGGHTHHRAKDLFLEHPHLIIAFKQGGLDVEAVFELTFELLPLTTDQHFGTFLTADVHVRHDLIELLLGGLSPYLNLGIQRIAPFDGPGTLKHLLHEGLVHVFLHHRPGRTGAHFSLIEEPQHQAFNAFVDKLGLCIHHIRKVQVGRFAPQLDRRRDDCFGGTLENVRAYRGRAGKGDLGNAFTRRQRITGFGAVTVDDIDHRSEEHTSELQSRPHLVCRLLLEKKKSRLYPS